MDDIGPGQVVVLDLYEVAVGIVEILDIDLIPAGILRRRDHQEALILGHVAAHIAGWSFCTAKDQLVLSLGSLQGVVEKFVLEGFGGELASFGFIRIVVA